jgi:hypothetical protein
MVSEVAFLFHAYQISHIISHISLACYMSISSISHWFDHRNNICSRLQIMKLLIIHCSAIILLDPLRSIHPLQHPVLKHPQYIILLQWEAKFHTHTKRGMKLDLCLCEGGSKSFRTESITKYMLTFGITRWETTQKVMAAKLTRVTHKIAIQLNLVAESCTIFSSCSKRPVRKLLDKPSFKHFPFCTGDEKTRFRTELCEAFPPKLTSYWYFRKCNFDLSLTN